MGKSFQILFLIFIELVCFQSCSSEKSIKKEPSVKPLQNILFIGNSYTYRNGGVDYHLMQLTKGMKNLASFVTRAAKGKYHLYSHWEDEQTLNLLASKKWDKIILQEYSSGPIRDSLEFFKYGKLWENKIHSENKKTQLYLYATWGYQGTKTMVDSLNLKYGALSKIIGGTKVPVGMLWKKLETKINLFDDDGAHPNRMGTFLNACLFYEYLFEKDVTKTKHKDNLIPLKIQVQLKRWAHEFRIANT